MASFLLDLSKRNDAHGKDPTRIDLPVSRGDIADYLGPAIETVSRTVTRQRHLRGLDLCQHWTVLIRDIDRLSDLAEDEEGSFVC